MDRGGVLAGLVEFGMNTPRTWKCLDCPKTGEGSTYRIPPTWSGDPPRCPKCHAKRPRATYSNSFGGTGTFGRMALSKRREQP